MSFTFLQTVGLGALAGVTIFAGLPVARLGRPGPSRMAFLNAFSIGVLLFIFYDVIKASGQIVDDHMKLSVAAGAGYGALLVAGLGTGLLSLVLFERLTLRRRPPLRSGPGAMTAGSVAGGGRLATLAPGQRVALFIAVGIGLHNFSEGLAIGQSAVSGAYRLAGVLIVGFALHNITEGFGITGPLTGERPSWRFLGLLGVIGGGPTLLGTTLGYQFTSDALSVVFLALAAGAIMYVVGELQHAGRKIGAKDVGMLGLFAGFALALVTDMMLVAAGA